MPLPKGINTPEVREAWISERTAKLDDFERLVGKGLSRNRAARELGLSNDGIASIRRSVALLQTGRQHGPGSASNIDLGLALLSCLRHPGEALTCEDIASWCDCSRQAIQQIEKRALRKVRRRLGELLQSGELEEEVEQMLARLERPELV